MVLSGLLGSIMLKRTGGGSGSVFRLNLWSALVFKLWLLAEEFHIHRYSVEKNNDNIIFSRCFIWTNK
jgi:hypothetical protein